MTSDTIVRQVNFTLAEQWQASLEAWGKFLRSAAKPADTIKLREYQLARFAHSHPHLALADVTLDVLAAWLAGFDWKPETTRSYRAALRTFFDWAHVSGRITTNPAWFLPAITPPEHDPRPTPEEFFADALSRAQTEREKRMVELTGYQGLRVGEVSRVRTDDLERYDERWVLRVYGKGRKYRRVPLFPSQVAWLQSLPVGYAFPGAIDGHLSSKWVGRLISRLLPTGWAGHANRHRYATKFYAVEHDIRALQMALGHRNLNTTQIYTKAPDDALWRGMQGVGLDMIA